MKKCLRCGQNYSDDSLNFCLNDGELLVTAQNYEQPTRFADDTPPTILMNEPRVTNPIDWAQSAPVQWPQHSQPAQVPLQHYPMAGYGVPQNTTLATISLVLGIV